MEQSQAEQLAHGGHVSGDHWGLAMGMRAVSRAGRGRGLAELGVVVQCEGARRGQAKAVVMGGR